jgi:predicted extracellular nuclease
MLVLLTLLAACTGPDTPRIGNTSITPNLETYKGGSISGTFSFENANSFAVAYSLLARVDSPWIKIPVGSGTVASRDSATISIDLKCASDAADLLNSEVTLIIEAAPSSITDRTTREIPVSLKCRAPITTPSGFSLTLPNGSANDLEPKQVVTSNSVVIAGLDIPVPVTVQNGVAIINGSAASSTNASTVKAQAVMVKNGDTLAVQITAATDFEREQTTTVTVGSSSVSLKTKTKANSKSLTLTLDPKSLDLGLGESGTVKVSIVRGGFEGAVEIDSSNTTGLSISKATIAASETSATLTVKVAAAASSKISAALTPNGPVVGEFKPVIMAKAAGIEASAELPVKAVINNGPLRLSKGYTFQRKNAGQMLDSQKPTIEGGTPPYQFKITPALPSGIVLDSNDGSISGASNTPQKATEYSVIITDTAQTSINTPFVLTIIAKLAVEKPYGDIGVTLGRPIAPKTPEITGGTLPYSFAIAPALPKGLVFDSQTGSISGKGEVLSNSKDYLVTVSDALGQQITLSFKLLVTDGIGFLNALKAASATVGRPLNPTQAPSIFGGVAPYRFSIDVALPAGMQMDTATGVITGTPGPTASTNEYIITVFDSNGASGKMFFTLIINPKLSLVAGYPDVNLFNGQQLSTVQPVIAGGTLPLTFAITPSIKTNTDLDFAGIMTLANTNGGSISGSANTVSAETSYVVSVTDDNGDRLNTSFKATVVQRTLSLTINPGSRRENNRRSSATISRNNTLGDLTVNLASSSPTIAPPTSVVIANGQSSASFDVQIIDDNIVNGDRDLPIVASAALHSSASATVRVIDDEVGACGAVTAISKTISEIQGAGSATSLSGIVTSEGVVVADFEGASPGFQGFYIQSLEADLDNQTSEGLFVFNGNNNSVAVGDLVRVTGSVGEFGGLTQISAQNIVKCGTASLPAPTSVNFPLPNGQSDLEVYEGMVVQIPDTLYVTEHFQLGRFGEVVVSSDGPGNQSATDGRLDQYTQFNLPSVAGNATYQTSLARRRLLIDDGQNNQNPDPIKLARGGNPLAASNTLRGGDSLNNVTGIVDFRFSVYRLQPTVTPNFVAVNARPSTPAVAGSLKVASINVLNFFNSLGSANFTPGNSGCMPIGGRGADDVNEFNRQLPKTVAAVRGLGADIVGLIEIQNNGDDANSAIKRLTDGLNAVDGAAVWDYVRDPVGANGNPGCDAIKLALVYKTAAVAPLGKAKALNTPANTWALQRPPLAQSFRHLASGGNVTVVMNHLKSKSSAANLALDADQNDGQGLSNASRVAGAQATAAWVNQAGGPTGLDGDVLMLGDFNAYAKEDPIMALESAGLQSLLPLSSYSYVFSGQWGSLDHAIGNANLRNQVVGAAKYHINSDEPSVLDYNTNFKTVNLQNVLYAPDQFRASDHDGLVVGLNLQADPLPATPSISVSNSSTAFLGLPATASGFASGVLSDPSDPASTLGIDFVLADSDTPVGSLLVSAVSSNGTVVPNANLVLSGSGANRKLKITPIATGKSTITVTVSDGLLDSNYTVEYAASAASNQPASTRFHTGVSDGSTVIAIDSNYMLVADDENQGLRLYDRQNSGLPLKSFDFTSSLGLTDLSGGNPREVDIEASTKSGNIIYWLGSHSNSSSGNNRPNRSRLFATTLGGSGINSTLSYLGRYDGLKSDLVAWDSSNAHGLGANFFGLAASSAASKAPEAADGAGFNIEGLSMAPGSSTTAYIGLRAPISPTNARTKALIVPVTNINSLVSGNPSAGPALFGAPIQLDLGGRGIRSLECNASECLMIAGNADGGNNFALYTWNGTASGPTFLRSADLSALGSLGSFEGIVEVPASLSASSQLQLIVDNGDTVYYNGSPADATIAKDLPQNNWKKFRSELVSLGNPPIPSVSLAVSSSSGNETGSTVITVTANASGPVASAQSLTLAITGAGITAIDYSLSNTTIIIPADSSSGSVTFTVADDNFIEGNETAILTIANPSVGITLASPASQSIFITDNDTAGVTITQSGSNTSVAEGGAGDSYTVVLNTIPTATVTVTISPNSQLTASVPSLIFTSANWNVPQSVTVGAVDDLVAEGSHSGSIGHSSSSGDGNYSGLTIATINATISDNDIAGVTIAQSGGNTSIAEGGAGDSYTVVLNTIPTANVTVTVSPNNQLTTLPPSLVFTPANWNTPQSVTVNAVDDFVVEGNHSGSIGHSSASSDGYYNSLTIATINATITDNDIAGVTIAPSGADTSVSEGGAGDNYTVVLNTIPSSNVTVTITPDSQVTASPSSLVFSPANWNTPQTVTVNAVDDFVVEGNHSGSISHSSASSDGNYSGLTIAAISTNITDNDIAGVTIAQSGADTAVTEGGAGDNYTVVLNTIPSSNVTITITPNSQVTAVPSSLTFTPMNWNMPQTVTASAIDDSVVEGAHSGSISHSSASGDSNYNSLVVASVSVTISDNDPSCSFANPITNSIGAIQGTGNAAAITGVQTFEGVVTADFQGASPNLGGFFVQAVLAGDGNAATSDGLYVFAPGAPDVNVGDFVRVTGTISEFNNGTQASGAVTVAICGTAALPSAIDIAMPLTNGQSDLERYENMLVRFTSQLTVTEHFQLGRFGQVVLSSSGASNQSGTDDRLDQFTAFNAPSVAGLSAYNAELDKRRLFLDDASLGQNPDPIKLARGGNPLSASNSLRGGDSISNLSGVLNQGCSAATCSANDFNGAAVYRVQPTAAVNFVAVNARTSAPPVVGGSLKIASFNVLNYFNQIDTIISTSSAPTFLPPAQAAAGGACAAIEARGAESFAGANPIQLDPAPNLRSEFARQRAKTVAAIQGMDADIVGVIEMQNNGSGASSAIVNLAAAVNKNQALNRQYSVIADPSDPAGSGCDAIKVAFLYRASSVVPLGASLSTSAVTVSGDPAISSDSNVLGSMNGEIVNVSSGVAFTIANGSDPNGDTIKAYDANQRKPIAVTFRQLSNGASFTAVMNHLKSKGSAASLPGDTDQNDGQGASNATRLAGAKDLAAWLATNPTGNSDPDYLLMGDFNAYHLEDPLTYLAGVGYPNLLPISSYSYVFGQTWGSLDHALGSNSLGSQVASADKWHINSDEPSVLDYNLNFKSANLQTNLYNPQPYRTSDHDPVLVGLNLATPPACTGLTISANPGSSIFTSASTTLSAVFSPGGCLESTPISWSTVGSLVSVNPGTGSSTSVTAGSLTGMQSVSVTAGALSANITITVNPIPCTLTAISVTPANPGVAKGLTQQLSANATYSPAMCGVANITNTVTWASATPANATISNAVGTQGLASAVNIGTSSISATLGAISGSTTMTVAAPALVSMAVTPTNPSIAKGLTQQLTATGTYSDMSTQNITNTVTWASATTANVTISNAVGTRGLATAVNAGTSTITATLGAINASTTMTVTPAVLVSIAVTPGNPSISVGNTQQFTATGTYSDTTTQNLTTSAIWASATPATATISNAGGSEGLATALANGSSSITATVGAISGNATLTVTAATLVSIAITPNNPSIAKGLTQQFTAIGTYSDMTTQNLTSSVTWASGDTNVATVSNAMGSQGLGTAVNVGSTTITATLGAITGSTTMTVTPAVLVSIAVTPATPSITVGNTQQFAATGTYSDASNANITNSVTWASATMGVATINATGLASAVAAGSSSISATSGAISGTAALTVSAASGFFANGNLAIYRVGDGTAALSGAAAPIFIDEYTTTGTFVKSVAMPTTVSGSNKRLLASGSATSEGLMTLSTNGKCLLLTGYDAAPATAAVSGTTSAATNRVIGVVKDGGASALVDTTTALADFGSTSNARGATSSNCTDLWGTASGSGVRYATLGATTSTQLSTTITNLRSVHIFAGQLYISTSSGGTVRVGTVGTGLPITAGQTITNLPSFLTAGSPYAFFLADLDAGVAGVDTLYVADDTSATGGLQKFSLVSGAWASNGTVGAGSDAYRGLTGKVVGTTVTLYATRKGGSGATGGGELVSLVDNSGYNATFMGTPTLLASAATNTAFRGVAFVPQP